LSTSETLGAKDKASGKALSQMKTRPGMTIKV